MNDNVLQRFGFLLSFQNLINKKYLGFLILVLMFINLNAQQKNISGLVVVDFSEIKAEGIYIENRRTKITSVTDISGHFQIEVQLGDTLLFHSPFVVSRKFTMTPVAFNKHPLIVHIHQEVIELADLVVKPELTGYLEKDIKTVEINNDIEDLYKKLGIDIRVLDIEPKEKRAKVFPRLGSIPIPTSLNIESIYKNFSGYYRRMENLDKYEKLEDKLNGVKDYLGNDFFKDDLKIPEQSIREFLEYTDGNSDGKYDLFFKQQDYLNMERLLEVKSDSFKKRLRQRGDKVDNDTLYYKTLPTEKMIRTPEK